MGLWIAGAVLLVAILSTLVLLAALRASQRAAQNDPYLAETSEDARPHETPTPTEQ